MKRGPKALRLGTLGPVDSWREDWLFVGLAQVFLGDYESVDPARVTRKLSSGRFLY
jgi:hypothetical protein